MSARQLKSPHLTKMHQLFRLYKENKLASIGGFFDLKPRCYQSKKEERDFEILLDQDTMTFSRSLTLNRRDQYDPSPRLEFTTQNILNFESIAGNINVMPYFILTVQTEDVNVRQYYFKNPFNESESKELTAKMSKFGDKTVTPFSLSEHHYIVAVMLLFLLAFAVWHLSA